MADPPSVPPGARGFWPDWLTPRRAWEFARNVINLEQTVSSLRDENRKLGEELLEVQRTLADHEAQLRLLTAFVRDSLSNRLEAKIDKIAAEIADKKNNRSL